MSSLQVFREPTLDEFVATWRCNSCARSTWLHVPGFKLFYARIGPKCIGDRVFPEVLTLANIETKRKHKGTFTRLVAKLHKQGIHLYVENVVTFQFSEGLERLGFTKARGPSFYLLAKDT